MQDLSAEERKEHLERSASPNNTPFEMTEIIAVGMSSVSARNYSESFSPILTKFRVYSSMMRQFFKRVNPRLFEMTTHKLADVLISCKFKLREDCGQNQMFAENHDALSCFTFNQNGTEVLNSAEETLEMTLFRNASEVSGSYDGTDSFFVVIHEPNKAPSVQTEGIPFHTGRSTTIRVERTKMNLENTAKHPCRMEQGYTKEQCLYHCVGQQCVERHDGCHLFSPPSTESRMKNETTVSESDLNFCIGAALYSQGIERKDLEIDEVSLCNVKPRYSAPELFLCNPFTMR